MTDANANNPIIIDESIPDWYAQTIFRKALLDIPDHFEKIPGFETLNFRHCEGFGPTVIANCITSNSKNRFAILETVKSVNRQDFWQDFTNSCSWIANEGRPPKLQRKVQRQVARSALPAALAPAPVPVVSALNAIAPKKRAGDEEPEVAPARIKRRDYSHSIRQPFIINSRSSSPERPAMATSVDARLRISEAANDLLKAEIATQARSLEIYQARVTANHQLQAQVTSLTAQVTCATHESLYSQNAYRGIQVECEHLRRQHVSALTDGKGLREQLRQSQLRCTQAEERSMALEAELERLGRKMKEARERLDDPSL